MSTGTRKRVGRWLLGLWLCCSTAAIATDPFFVARLREGRLAHQRAEYAEAVRLLRVANFGFLGEPTLLAEGLSWLALSQLALGEEDSYLRTFTRLLDLEERFSAFSSAELPSSLREQMANFLTVLPSQLIEESPIFAELAAEAPDTVRASDEGSVLSRRQRRRAAQASGDPEAKLALAEMRLEGGRFSEAARLADEALGLTPANGRASCLRDASLANARRDCETVVESLQTCEGTSREPLFIRGLMRCLLQLDRADEALRLLEQLDTSVRQETVVERVARSVYRKASRQSVRGSISENTELQAEPSVGAPELGPEHSLPDTPELALEATAAPVDPQQTAVAEAEPAPTREEAREPQAASRRGPGAAASPEDRALARARRVLSTSSSISELEAALATTRAIARRLPHEPEARLLAAALATRAGRWITALTYFRDAAPLDAARADLHFYLAVALEEAGYSQAAQTVLASCRDRLPEAEWIRGYVDRIAIPGG